MLKIYLELTELEPVKNVYFTFRYGAFEASYVVLCFVGCPAGVYGSRCNITCPFPTFGQGCLKTCNCLEDQCDYINGCKKGYIFLISKPFLSTIFYYEYIIFQFKY